MASSERTGRVPDAPIDPQFVERRSTRAFRSDPLTSEQVASVFEAARWSPSCFNDQPWLFVYATEDGPRRRVLDLLAEGNRRWAHAAPLLGVVFARRHFEHNGKPNRWGPFDSGAASLALALQAHMMGLEAHFMGGFDAARAHEELGVSKETHDAMAAFAVGVPGDPAALPEDIAKREAPSIRKPRAKIAVALRPREE